MTGDTEMSVRKQRRAGVLLSYLTMGLSTIISLIYTPYMLRCLSQSEYGLYQLIGSLAQYLSLLSMGLSGSYIRFYSTYKEKRGQRGVASLNAFYSIVFFIISIFVLITGSIIALNLPLFFGRTMSIEELSAGRIMMVLMTINTAVTLPRTIFTGFISANERFVFHRLVSLSYAILHPLACVVALYYGGKAVSLVVISLISAILLLTCEVIFSIKKIGFRLDFHHLNVPEFLGIFSFSFYVFLNDIINQINWSIDKVILGFFSGTLAIAVYGLAAQLNTYYLQISTAISSVYAPKINRIIAGNESDSKKNDAINRIFFDVGRIQYIVVMLVITGYIFLGRQFIILWAGKDYTEAYYIGLWLMIPVCVPLMQNTGIEIQRAKNKHKIRSIVYGVIAVLNVFISIPLCKRFGALGCAMGTAISLICGNIIFINWYYYKHLDIDIPAFWKNIAKMLPGLILPTIAGVFILKFASISNYLDLFVYIVIYTFVYLLGAWIFVFKENEKHALLSFFYKFIKRK